MYEKIRGSIHLPRHGEGTTTGKASTRRTTGRKRPAPQALIQTGPSWWKLPALQRLHHQGAQGLPDLQVSLYNRDGADTENLFYGPRKLIIYGVHPWRRHPPRVAVYLLHPDLFAGAKPEVDLFDAKGK